MGAILRERSQMMQLEIVRFATAQAASVEKRTSRAVSSIHFPPHCCSNISTPLARCFGWGFAARARFDALAQCFGWGFAALGRRARFDALARCFGWGFAALGRRARFDALARLALYRELSFFEGCDEEPHGLEVQLSERDLWARSSEQCLRPLHQVHVLFNGGELHLEDTWTRDGRQVQGYGTNRKGAFVVCRDRIVMTIGLAMVVATGGPI
jgi:hypothetical protein